MNLRTIESPPLFKLLGYLEAVSDCIRSGELKWYFDVTLFESDDIVVDISLLVKTAYPESLPEKAEIREVSITNVADTFKYHFCRGSQPRNLSEVLHPSYGGLWEHLNECLQLDESRFYEYRTSDRLDVFGGGGIAGEFAFVIVNDKLRQCLLLSAGDCD